MLAIFLSTIGEKMFGEDTFPGSDTGVSGYGQLSPKEADAEINSIYDDKSHPYHTKDNHQYAAAQEQMLKLFAMKRGERVR